MKNILIIGLDGVGKTTHARSVIEKLSLRGIKTRYVYMRGYGRVFLALPFLVLSRLLGLTKVHRLENGLNISEYFFFTNKTFRILWPWVSLIDSFFYSLIIYYLHPLLNNTITISDRCVIDTLIDILVDTRDKYYYKYYGRYFLNIIPKNSIVVMLDADERTVMERKKDIPRLRYLKMRRDIYKKLANFYGWTIINTDEDFKTVHKKIFKIIFSYAHC